MSDTTSQLKTMDPASESWSDDCDCLHPEAVGVARKHIEGSPEAEAIANVFTVLGDPTRMTVLLALQAGELCVTDLAAATGVNRTTISHQLRVLRANRLVRRRRDGKVMYYALDDDHITDLMAMAIAHVSEATIASIAGTKRVTA